MSEAFAVRVRPVRDFGMFEYPEDPFDFVGVGSPPLALMKNVLQCFSNSRTTFGVISPSVRMGACDRFVCIMVAGFKSDISSAFIRRTRMGILLSEESELMHVRWGWLG